MAVINETPKSRQFSIGPETGERTLRFWVAGTGDETEAEGLIQALCPATYLGLFFQSYTAEPDEDGLGWNVEAKYGRRQPKEIGQGSVSFDTGGGTAHITQAKQHVVSYAVAPTVAPDFKGAIGVTGDSVEGCDITVPALTYQETWIVPAAIVTSAYVKLLRSMTGKVNSATFRDFDLGEMLFKGAAGSTRDGVSWEITFKWDVGENIFEEAITAGEQDPIMVGDIEVTDKDAWDYLWVRYKEVESNNVLVKQPLAAYVERVYDDDDFNEMFPWIP